MGFKWTDRIAGKDPASANDINIVARAVEALNEEVKKLPTGDGVPTKLSQLENDAGYLKENSENAYINYGEGYKVNIGASTDVSIASGNKVYLSGRKGTVIYAEESEIAADFSNQRIANIADPKADTDGANKKYVDDAVKNGSGGINSTSAALIIEILRSAVYDTDQSANIDALETALSGGELPDVPDVPTVETLPLTVVLGNITRLDGSRITYDVTSASAAIRATMNPIAVYMESGKTYKIALSDYSTYGIGMQRFTYSTKGTDFTVVEGTQKAFNGDFTRTYTSGWKHEDIVYTADGTEDIFIVMLAKGSAHNEELTANDIVALNGLLTVTVE